MSAIDLVVLIFSLFSDNVLFKLRRKGMTADEVVLCKTKFSS